MEKVEYIAIIQTFHFDGRKHAQPIGRGRNPREAVEDLQRVLEDVFNGDRWEIKDAVIKESTIL